MISFFLEPSREFNTEITLYISEMQRGFIFYRFFDVLSLQFLMILNLHQALSIAPQGKVFNPFNPNYGT